MLRSLLIALSFVNICYLRIWSELLTFGPNDTYLMVTPPKPAEYLALMANVVLTAAVLWGLAVLSQRVLTERYRRFAEMAFVLALCIPLNAIRSVLSQQFPYLKSPMIELLGMRGVAILGICIVLIGLIAIVFFHRAVSLAAAAVFAVLSPFCAVTFGHAVWKVAKYDESAYGNKPSLPVRAAEKSGPRVIWFIADEWDYGLTFVRRDPALRLAEIDKLRATALSASNAFPPGPETPVAIPGYYTGRLVDRVRYDGPSELQVVYRGETAEVPWSMQPNVFDHARELGFNTALLEWFHPSCRVLTGLNRCEWWPLAMQHNSMGEGFWRILANQPRSLFETNLFSVFGRSLATENHALIYHAILDQAERLSSDPAVGFSLVHLPVPHAPHSYNRKTGEFTLGNAPIRGYIDSLALLDRTIGEIRSTMEKAGTWDSTTVLFTSDHPYREAEALAGESDPRIPYLLKFASQKEGAVYDGRFNTVLTGQLLLAVLRGEVSDAAAAEAWLTRNRGQVPEK